MDVIEEKGNELSDEFIFKTCKSFRICVDIIIEKDSVHTK